jgi:short-subunit dehydrogenase
MSNREFPVKDRHVLVTGASRGIGEQLATELVTRGAQVTVVARSATALKVIADRIGAQAIAADLVDEDQRSSLISRVESENGPVDVLVNNAALALVGPFWEFQAADLRDTITLNLYTPMELSRQVLPGMIARRRGMVVNVSSLAAMAVMPTVAPYSAAKAGLTHFTAALQRELRGSGVGALIVQLGEVAGTDLVENTRLSGPIAVASRRLDRLKVMRQMSLQEVATKMSDAIEDARWSLVLPRRMTPLHHLREIPNRLNDILLAGDGAKLEFRR